MTQHIETATHERPDAKGGFSVKRLLPLAVIAAGIGAFFALGLDRYVTFDALRDNRAFLMHFVEDQGFLAVLLFVAIYAVSTALSLPGGAVLTIAGGFLFGSWLGAGYVVIGATLGSVAVFLIARTALGDTLRARAGPSLKKMEAGFQENALSYLLVLRLIPLFPFFVVNIVPAFLGVRLRTYVIATFVGIIPGSFVFATVGAGLGSIFDSNAAFTPSAALTPEVVTALVGLSDPVAAAGRLQEDQGQTNRLTLEAEAGHPAVLEDRLRFVADLVEQPAARARGTNMRARVRVFAAELPLLLARELVDLYRAAPGGEHLLLGHADADRIPEDRVLGLVIQIRVGGHVGPRPLLRDLKIGLQTRAPADEQQGPDGQDKRRRGDDIVKTKRQSGRKCLCHSFTYIWEIAHSNSKMQSKS